MHSANLRMLVTKVKYKIRPSSRPTIFSTFSARVPLFFTTLQLESHYFFWTRALAAMGLMPQRYNYCCYQIMLTDPLVHPTPKSTSILTNVSGWVPRRCPDLENHDAHTAVISGPNSEERPSFFNIPEETCVFMKPEGLDLDIAASAIQR